MLINIAYMIKGNTTHDINDTTGVNDTSHIINVINPTDHTNTTCIILVLLPINILTIDSMVRYGMVGYGMVRLCIYIYIYILLQLLHACTYHHVTNVHA